MGNSIQRDQLVSRLHDFRPFLPSWPEAEKNFKPNILTIGAKGVAKSGTNDAILSVLRQSMSSAFPSAPSDFHHTTHLKKVDISRFGFSACLVDVPGWCNVEWVLYLRLLMCIVKGKVQNGEELYPMPVEKLEDIEARPAAPFKNQIHCILILIPSKVNQPKMNEQVRQVVASFDRSAPCVVLNTKADMYLPADKNFHDLSDIADQADVVAGRKAIATAVGIHENCVLPVASYAGPVPYPCIAIEILILRALLMAAGKAEAAFEYEAGARARRQQSG